MGEKQDMYSGSLPTPLSISQPVVKEWFDKNKANLRPFRTFFNTVNFQVPPSGGRLTKRLYKNIEYFQSNYVLVFVVLVVYCIISSPLLPIVIAAAGGASYIASMRNSERKLAIAGHKVSLSQQYGLISVCSIPFFLWAGAGGIVFWVLGASMFFITAHAAFYNYDALEVAVTQSQNQHKENPILSNMGEKQEHSEVAEKLGFVVDELVETCSQSKENAEKFIDMILKKNVERRKSEVLPLQGDLWKQWSELDKEQSKLKRIAQTDPGEYQDKMRNDKNMIRKKQQQIHISDEMSYFMETLFKINEDERRYFLEWCQLGLNKISEAKIEEEIEKEKKEMKNISQQFDTFSMGIEHLFREFGQLYEVHNESKENNPYNNLPMLMAELMVMGYPLELMDGNVSHVPVTWLKAVFTELEKKIGKNRRVSVMSIIGIQISGKSTLLNTMFGSKFAVSSGRCTKGVFLQLFPLQEDLRETLKCDYVLIMDSEGLRSPELEDQFEHDNVIATFITSLANTFPKFLPSLWQGQMSAPVSRYGELVKTLRNSLIQSLSSEESSGFRRTQTIEDFMTRISDVWKAVKTESFVFAFRNSQSIHIYKGMQHFYDVEMGTLRTFIFDEVNTIGNNVKQEDLESITHASTKLSNGTLEVMSKALEKKKEIEEKFDEKVKTSENPDMAAKFLPDFVFDMRRKIESWIESDEKQILNEIRGILKRKEKEKKTLRNNFSEDIKATDRDARLGTMIFQDILREVIAMKTKSRLGQKIYNDILKSKTFMHKSNMMFYLHEELLQATGEEVHRYCNHYKSYVEEWIQNKMRKFCEEDAYLEKQVKSRTKTAVEFVIDTVQQAMTDAEEKKRTPFAWFELLMKSLTKDGYSEELKEKQTVFQNRIMQIKNLDAVSKRIIEGLHEYKSNITKQESDDTMTALKSLSFNPIKNLIDERIGCTAQCPFCGAVCDNGFDCAGTNRKHVAELHRPKGCIGMSNSTTKILVTNNCSTDVSTEQTYINVRGLEGLRYYKNVATDIPDWTIKPETAEAQEFWQRLFYLHNQKIAEITGVKPAKTPSGWSNVTEKRALENLKDMYKVLE